MRHRCFLLVGHNGLDIHFARVLCAYGQVAQVGVWHSHQFHIAEDAAGCPIVVVVEVAATKLSDNPHGQLLLRLFLVDEGSNVEEGGIVP